ncbi:MAG: hypothetical protein RIG84_12250 [Roseovarius sp.]
MPSDGKKTDQAKPDSQYEPPTPLSEREPGESAKTGNPVKARDAFGRPRNETEWSREAIATTREKPALDKDGNVVAEQSRKFRG